MQMPQVTQSAVSSLMAQRCSLQRLAGEFVSLLTNADVLTLHGRKELMGEIRAVRTQAVLLHGSREFREEVESFLDLSPVASAKWNVMSFRYPHLRLA